MNKTDFEIFVKERAVLNKQIREAYEELDINLEAPPKNKDDGVKRKKKGEAQGGEIEKGRNHMCKKFFDVRTFGAVMSTGPNAGQVRGPVQLTFARSIDPIVSLEHSITVCAARTEERSIEEQIGIQGRKHTVSYSLYRCHGFISAPIAEQTGFCEEDLKLFWDALCNMFEHDRSAARGEMNARKLVVFQHESKLGKHPAHKLFERVQVSRANDSDRPARSFADYVVAIDKSPIEGVRVDEKL
jgi:CRISPR-associated protein Csd2